MNQRYIQCIIKRSAFYAILPSWGWDMYANKYVRIRIPEKAEGWLRLFYPKSWLSVSAKLTFGCADDFS